MCLACYLSSSIILLLAYLLALGVGGIINNE